MSLKAKALFFIVVFLLLFLLFSESKISYAQSNNVIGNRVIVITVSGVIDSAVEEYVSNAIAVAEKKHAILVIYLNTPGGLLDSAMNIAIDIDKSTIPVIGFVVDKWAESAGTLIFVCTHIAAMQPGTIIGSMQPI
ncbi:MAG: ATP-dependent Clp protease proteolytic subunit, partial [Fervidicoccus fontis]